MNKFETTMVVILFVALGGWWFGYRSYVAPVEKQRAELAAKSGAIKPGAVNGSSTNLVNSVSATNIPALPVTTSLKEDKKAEPVAEPAAIHNEPQEFAVLSNDRTDVKVSSWGGVVVSVTLKKYRETIDKKSGPVILDLSNQPALAYGGIPALSRNCDFKITRNESGRKIHFEKTLAPGVDFVRTIELGDGYQLQVTDMFQNKSGTEFIIPKCQVQTGPMRMIHTVSGAMGYQYLGIDTLPSGGGESVLCWANKGPAGDKMSLSERFQPGYRQGGGCSAFKQKLEQPLPAATNVVRNADTDWVAVKNKFFVQILAPKGGGSGVSLNVRREVPKTEDVMNKQSWVQSATLEEVSAAMSLRERTLKPGETISSDISFYAGPKEYAMLKLLGNKQDDVMEFGFWSPVSKLLLLILTFLYKMVPNYGVAVILLTLLVRIAFWPVTHKSTESMKKLQKIQPLINQIREKYKDKPQKMNQEIMAVYKEQKVNPMSGCLPILVQIPVFIALFTVLRSAVELRFTEFLWIKDLSEPENLLAGILPIGLNILPIAMAATMFWQQKLTPTAGDAQQQKMMLYMMPIMMLFMFYNMASALVLYWTVSQVISIYQLYRQKRKAVEEEAVGSPARK